MPEDEFERWKVFAHLNPALNWWAMHQPDPASVPGRERSAADLASIEAFRPFMKG